MNGRVQRTLLLSSLLLAALPVTPAEAGGGCHSAGPEVADTVAGTEVEMVGNCFLPAVLAVDEGATVRFTNYDEINHVVAGTRWGIAGEIAPGRTADHQFLRRGAYPYSCYLHPGMNGVILVGDPAPAVAPAPAAALPAAAPEPTKQAVSSTSSGDSDVQPLALGALAGLAVGSAATSRRFGLRRRRTSSSPSSPS